MRSIRFRPQKSSPCGTFPVIRRLVLGENATEEELQARSLPGKNSPKRSIPMEIDTPRKKSCHRTGAQAITSSPLLRPKLEPTRKETLSVEAKLNEDGQSARAKRLVKQPLISSMFMKENADGDK